ncbi:hypothetical protein JJB07_03905 [Tumebacillus sp. ITR2]|uniref:Uncharacterized protein n=1 Tax=Tumebacillus amylolyticus TaxID=2801339 RepID=A0ABS1J6F4_9BACL|nr:hypothetical protein [Tumebacillus amylolyticus]MBL0385785.1 hypothetical protein [Tumebacillus amylolyticus]
MTIVYSAFANSRMRLLNEVDQRAVRDVVYEMELGLPAEQISTSSARTGTVLDQPEKITVHLNGYYLCFRKEPCGYNFLSIVKEDEVVAV